MHCRHARCLRPASIMSGLDVKRGDFVISNWPLRLTSPRSPATRSTTTGSACRPKAWRGVLRQRRHAQHVANQFCEAGYSAVRIDGAMDRHERRRNRAVIQETSHPCHHVVRPSSRRLRPPAIECGISDRLPVRAVASTSPGGATNFIQAGNMRSSSTMPETLSAMDFRLSRASGSL